MDLGGDADGAGDGAFARRAVRLDHHAVEAEQRRAAINFRVHAAFDGAKGVLGQQRAELAFGVAHQFAFEHGKHRHGEAFGGFQNDVADEAVADDDIHAVFEQVVALDVADEIQIEFLQSLKASSVSSLPLESSVPMLKMPTRGFLRPRISRE